MPGRDSVLTDHDSRPEGSELCPAFLKTLETALIAQITLAISHLPLGEIRTHPLTGRINSLSGEQPLTAVLILSPRQPAATRSQYCPWRLLTSPAPKLAELQVAELLRKVEACCKDNQAAHSSLPHAIHGSMLYR